MKVEYKEAFSEIDEILNLMPKTLSEKIPQKFKETIKSGKSNTYKPNIQYPIDKCNLRKETKIILSLIYRDFLCGEDKRKELKQRDAELLRKYEEDLRKKYNPDNIFKSRKKRD